MDIGFGDAIEPGLEALDLPVLLDQPPPRLRGYARETVVAEKFQAMVMLGAANTRLKDYYDIWVLARGGAIDPKRLALAVAATFERRTTPIPVGIPDGLSDAYAADPARVRQWANFIEDVAVEPGSLATVVDELAAFLMPVAVAAIDFESGDAKPEGQTETEALPYPA